MPRRDGFPTNNELITELETEALDTFAAAYERSLQHKLPPAYEGKPLGVLRLDVSMQYDASAQLDAGIQHPLEAETIQYEVPPYAPSLYHIRLQRMPGEIARRERIAQQIAQLTLSDSFAPRQTLETGAVQLEYIAKHAGRRPMHFMTDDEKPSKQRIISAKYFNEEVRRYIDSDIFDYTRIERILRFDIDDPEYAPQHRWSIRYEPDLPLNGKESAPFLESYRDYLSNHIIASRQEIDRLRAITAAEFLIDLQRERLEKAERSIERVDRLLGLM